MLQRPNVGRFFLAAGLVLAMIASLLWFNIQTSRNKAVDAVYEALGSGRATFVIDGRRDFPRPGAPFKYNNLWCGTFTSGPLNRFAVLVRQPGGRRYGRESVIDVAVSPATTARTASQTTMLEACASVWR